MVPDSDRGGGTGEEFTAVSGRWLEQAARTRLGAVAERLGGTGGSLRPGNEAGKGAVDEFRANRAPEGASKSYPPLGKNTVLNG